MKMFSTEIELNAKTKLTFALCTALALSAASLQADDKDKDKSQGAAGANAATESGKLSRTDARFVHEAAKSGMMEVKMGKLAAERAQNAQLKQFGQRLADDHGKASAELKQIAATKGITLPETDNVTSTSPGTGTESDRTQVRDKSDAEEKAHKAHGQMMSKLEGLSGADFDRAFIRMAVTHHEDDVKEFEKASRDLDDAELKAFAAKTLPTLREHLSHARSLQSQVGNAGAPGSDSDKDSGNQSSGTGTSSGTSDSQTK